MLVYVQNFASTGNKFNQNWHKSKLLCKQCKQNLAHRGFAFKLIAFGG